MEWQEIEVDGRHTVKFTDLPYVPLTSPPQSSDSSDLFIGKKLGGILRHGEWGWLARNSVLQIVSLRNGQTISCYEFCESRGYESCHIKCVEEIYPGHPEIMLLAVVLESFRAPGGGCSYVAVYSVELSKVLHNIELSLHLTCARFMEESVCRRSLLQNFDGCLAVGSEEGVVILLNLDVRKLLARQNDFKEDVFVPCHIVDYSLPLTEVHRNFRQCQLDGVHFGLQIEVIESPCSIKCILPIDLILGLAIGLEDGRLALYDLMELQIFCVALPNTEVAMSALVKMDFLEPPDDPRPCLFIWTLHENGENLHAVLHSLMYEKRLVDEEESLTYFETFQNCSVRLQLPLEATKSVALACQAISSGAIQGEDDVNSLCIISWLSVLEGKNKLLIFDLNQWYKEEMPFLLEYGKQPNYLAGFILDGEYCGLQVLVNSNNIAHFNSIQRFEEHFYPNSLSFESLLLHAEGVRRYNWEGTQNRVVSLLRSSNAAIFLEPNFYFNEIIRTRLMPQFIELNINSTFSRNAKYEILLSVALEHNCVSLLRDCAKSWIDGSFMGNFSAATGLSLSTLTDWIWKRATCIKTRCNDLCKSLFDHQGYPLDSREQKELGFITRQLKLLAELLQEVLVYAKKQIPERVFNDLANKQSSLSMASNYQEILLWLLNIGLLPEAAPHNENVNARNADLIRYPYQDLKEFYKTKRLFYAKINETFISKKTGSCKLLFIDSFIEHVCKGNVLHEFWLENEGNGLYPPNSLEAMLRVMLVPDLKYDNKCAILLYFFLDLNMAIDEVIYKDVVANFIKFPSVFKLSAPLIKTVQAFWNLDHDHYLPAVDEFISPFNKNQNYPQWQVELLIEVLLNQKASNLALRILESQPSLISPLLKLNTLLANDLLSEAFHFVRSKQDDTLLETFFKRCLCNGQFGVIRDLALSEREGTILQNILKKLKSPGAESLHFVYLLQKSKYIEAVSYMEEMANRAKGMKTALQQTNHMDTPNLVLSAFNTTMTPVTQGLTDVYFRIKNKIKKKEIDNDCPVPLSCQLIKQNANSLLGGIYHSSALSAHFATYYWGEMEEQTKQTKHLLNSNNAPFLRRPQMDTNSRDIYNKNNISYPQPYKVNEKRTLIESEVLETEAGDERLKVEYKMNPKKKRRLIGQEIVEDLQHFVKMNKTLPATEFSFGAEQKEAKEMVGNETFDLLLRPLSNKPKEMEVCPNKEIEIQGILKAPTLETGQPREALNEEEKNIRFRLPSMEISHTSHLPREEEEVTLNEEINEEIVEEGAKEEALNFKNFSRSLSVESSKSSGSKSDDQFYSPLSSQNNSKLDCSNLSIQSILSGPQPRKPLARYSAERSEKSLTPDRELPTLEKTQYVTALETNFKTQISPRTALKHVSPEKTLSKEPSNLAYVTAKETFSLPLTPSQASKTKPEYISQTTSGYGSLGSTQENMAESKINEFLPKGCSSKLQALESLTKEPKPAKLSECSTVLGSFTTLESITNTISTQPSLIKSPNELSKDEQKRHMLETTLGMSSYDFTILETTSMKQTKSPLQETDKEDFTKTEEYKEEIKIKHVETTEKYFDEEEKEKEEHQSSLLENKEETSDICIVLSSSSSSSSLSDSPSASLLQEPDDSQDYSDPLSDREDEDVEDYERENEYENDDDDIEDIIDDEEREEESENENEINMEAESEISNDYLQHDNDDEDISMEAASEDSSVKANAEIIQLLEDSSADEATQQQGSFCDESESDDIKYTEDEISTDINEDYVEMKQEKEENKKKNSNLLSLTTDQKGLKASGSSPSISYICINENVSTTAMTSGKECEEQQEERKEIESTTTKDIQDKKHETMEQVSEAFKKSPEVEKQEKNQEKEQKEIKESKQLADEEMQKKKHKKTEKDTKEQEEVFKQKNTPVTAESFKDQGDVKKELEMQTKEASKDGQAQDFSLQENKEAAKEPTTHVPEQTKTKSPIKEKIEKLLKTSTEDPQKTLRMTEANEGTKESKEEEQEKMETAEQNTPSKAEQTKTHPPKEIKKKLSKASTEDTHKSLRIAEAKEETKETKEEKQGKMEMAETAKQNTPVGAEPNETQPQKEKIEKLSKTSTEDSHKSLKKAETNEGTKETKKEEPEKMETVETAKQATPDGGKPTKTQPPKELKEKLSKTSTEDPHKTLRRAETNEETKETKEEEQEKMETVETGGAKPTKTQPPKEIKEKLPKFSTEDPHKSLKKAVKNEGTKETKKEVQEKMEMVETAKQNTPGEAEPMKTKSPNKEKIEKLLKTPSEDPHKSLRMAETNEETKDTKKEEEATNAKKEKMEMVEETRTKSPTKEKIEKTPKPSKKIEDSPISLGMDESNEETKNSKVEEETHEAKPQKSKNSEPQEINKEKQNFKNNQKSKISNQEIDKKEKLKAQEEKQESKEQNIQETKTIAEEKNKEKSHKTAGEEQIEESASEQEDRSNQDSSLKQKKRKMSRGASVPPLEIEPQKAHLVSTPRRKSRGISVPPQGILETEEHGRLTPTTRRSLRASSVQPKSPKTNDNEVAEESKLKNVKENLETKNTRGSSVPPGAVEGKPISRRRSILLEAINEDESLLDSPSTRTRLRSRLNSGESEVDSPVLLKRTRKLSSTLNTQESALTPKRTRRDSFTSQKEADVSTTTPRTQRARSVISVQDEEEKEISHTPKRKRRESFTSHTDTPRSLRTRSVLSVQDEEHQDENSRPSTPKIVNRKKDLENEQKLDESLAEIQESPTSEASYSSSRRLTRTQLAIMEKSTSLIAATSQQAGTTITPPKNKRPRSRAARSANINVDSDDAESVSSKLSTASSVTGNKRRVTRSSVKEKDEDDGASVASSLGSEKVVRVRRSKDLISPNTTLTTIPEDAPIETKKRGRQTKH